MEGKQVHHGLYQSDRTELDISHLPKGVYILQLVAGEEVRQAKLVKAD